MKVYGLKGRGAGAKQDKRNAKESAEWVGSIIPVYMNLASVDAAFELAWGGAQFWAPQVLEFPVMKRDLGGQILAPSSPGPGISITKNNLRGPNSGFLVSWNFLEFGPQILKFPALKKMSWRAQIHSLLLLLPAWRAGPKNPICTMPKTSQHSRSQGQAQSEAPSPNCTMPKSSQHSRSQGQAQSEAPSPNCTMPKSS